MLALQCMHDTLLKRHARSKTYMDVKVKAKYEVHIYVMLALQCMYDNLLKRYGFCWALHAKWYPSVRLDEENSS